MDEIAKRILAEYTKSGYSYPELERLTGIPKSTLQRYFTGETEKMPLSSIEKIARAFEVDPAYLMGWKNKDGDDLEPENQGDLLPLREQLRRQPGMRILFNASKGATEQDLLDAAKLIEGFKRRRDGDE